MPTGAGGTSDAEPTRRTMLAAERTWLAYEDVPGNWITGLTLAGTALAIGTLALILAEA